MPLSAAQTLSRNTSPDALRRAMDSRSPSTILTNAPGAYPAAHSIASPVWSKVTSRCFHPLRCRTSGNVRNVAAFNEYSAPRNAGSRASVMARISPSLITSRFALGRNSNRSVRFCRSGCVQTGLTAVMATGRRRCRAAVSVCSYSLRTVNVPPVLTMHRVSAVALSKRLTLSIDSAYCCWATAAMSSVLAPQVRSPCFDGGSISPTSCSAAVLLPEPAGPTYSQTGWVVLGSRRSSMTAVRITA